jgi:hypothetical protein
MALTILNLEAKRGWVVNTTPQPLYPWELARLSIVQEAV